ncbi:MAG: hypothetical protein ACP5GO_00595 [Thermoprotei archaeon]
MKPQVKVEVKDASGSKLTIIMSGKIDPQKLNRIMSIVSEGQEDYVDYDEADSRGTLIDALYEAVQLFGSEWFDSKKARQLLRERLDKDVPLPVVSTYLSRLRESGKLVARGSRVHREYRIARGSTMLTPTPVFPMEIRVGK